MPELPEVEVIRQSLNKKIKQKTVKRVIIRKRDLRLKIPINFTDYLEDQKITKVDRFSKYLILHLSNKSFCLLHLGMSGTIHLIEQNKKKNYTNASFYNSPTLPHKHNHVEIIFENLKVVYNDPRRFGFFQIIKNSQDLKKRFKHFGPEPFDLKFNTNYFQNYIIKKNKNIKSLLIDQKFVSGIGNIYASEILFLSKIHPSKKIRLLNEKECNQIILNSKKILLNAIKKGGSSIRDFKNIEGNKGNFQDNFKVYQMVGNKCKRKKCKGKIIKKIISNRSTFFCNNCQK